MWRCMLMWPLAPALLAWLLLHVGAMDKNKEAFCDAVRSDLGLYGMVNCTHTSFPTALKPHMNFCKGNISGNVTYETHFRNLCEVAGYDTQVQACMERRMEAIGRVIRIPESEVTAYKGCINDVERRVHELRNGTDTLQEHSGDNDNNNNHVAEHTPVDSARQTDDEAAQGEEGHSRSRREAGGSHFLFKIGLPKH